MRRWKWRSEEFRVVAIKVGELRRRETSGNESKRRATIMVVTVCGSGELLERRRRRGVR